MKRLVIRVLASPIVCGIITACILGSILLPILTKQSMVMITNWVAASIISSYFLYKIGMWAWSIQYDLDHPMIVELSDNDPDVEEIDSDE